MGASFEHLRTRFKAFFLLLLPRYRASGFIALWSDCVVLDSVIDSEVDSGLDSEAEAEAEADLEGCKLLGRLQAYFRIHWAIFWPLFGRKTPRLRQVLANQGTVYALGKWKN